MCVELKNKVFAFNILFQGLKLTVYMSQRFLLSTLVVLSITFERRIISYSLPRCDLAIVMINKAHKIDLDKAPLLLPRLGIILY